MNAERWRQVEEIFNQAIERPEAERASWIQNACGGDAALRAEVDSLLESDRIAAGQFVVSQVEKAVVELSEAGRPLVEGRRLGPYRLIRELGRGGMGAVYLAARDDRHYESEVAIKVVRPGLDTEFILRRFRRERQILARLQHPNIARLFDGGTADDGTPYLVMEYIEGSWITRYAVAGNLNVEERLRLFLPVCAAVAHAHRNFIVHRDLKPGNILIDRSGIPKLLDFGVSKLLIADNSDAGETQGVGMMTPDYASPEQIVGDPVTVASDVYSLGAVLYELLTGKRPHRIERCTPLALERAICLDETVPPSLIVSADRTLSRRLSGDLDNIILRAMQKERERRYQTAELLSNDIRRHLEHRPVTARPDSATYRAGKFIRRNRLAVGLAALVVASLAGGVAVAVRQAQIAHQRFDQVRKLAGIFVFDVEQAARDLPGSTRLRQLITRTGLEYLGNLAHSAAGDWELSRELATAYMRIGDVQGGTQTSNLGDPAAALASYKSAEKLLDSVLEHRPKDRQAALDRMTLLHQISNLHRQMGNLPISTQATRDGARRAEAMLAAQPADPEIAQFSSVFHLDLARLKQQTGDLAGAAEEVAAGIERLKTVIEARPDDRETHGNIAASLARLGAVQADLGRREEALATYRKGVAELEEMVRRSPHDGHHRHELMLAYSHVGDILGNPAYDNFGDSAGAVAAYRKMEEVARGLHEADPVDMRATSDYGIALLRIGIAIPIAQGAEKRGALEKSHGLLSRAAAADPKNRPNLMHKAWSEVELGDFHLSKNDRSSAARYYQMAIATAEAAQALDPKDTASQRWLIAGARKLAEDHARSGSRREALASLEKALALAKRVGASAPASAIGMRAVVARGYQAAGSVYALLALREKGAERDQDRDAARNWYRQALSAWQALEKQPGFLPLHRKEMETAAEALAALNAAAKS